MFMFMLKLYYTHIARKMTATKQATANTLHSYIDSKAIHTNHRERTRSSSKITDDDDDANTHARKKKPTTTAATTYLNNNEKGETKCKR